VGTQIELFEAVDRVVWRRLPEEARAALVDLVASLLVRHIEGLQREGSDVGDDR
jgi:hypothetical protein